MAYIVCKEPNIRLSLMVKKEYWPKLVGHIERTGCIYKKEESVDLGTDDEWICVKDIDSNGQSIGELLGLLFSLEWDSVTEGKDDKFYILLNTRRKGKKNDHKDRKETGTGSKGGNSGEAAGNA